MLAFKPTYNMESVSNEVKAQLEKIVISQLVHIAIAEVEEKTSLSAINTDISN